MVNESVMLDVVLDFHVLVKLILSIETAIDSLSIKFLELVAAHDSRTLSLPFLNLTVLPHSFIYSLLPSWSSRFSPLDKTHLERALAKVRQRAVVLKPSAWRLRKAIPSLKISIALLLGSTIIYQTNNHNRIN
jgi:hypothetical protein